MQRRIVSDTSPSGGLPALQGGGSAPWLLGLAIVAIGSAILVGVGLGGYPLWDPDEARHAEIAREMLAGGLWLEPTINFEPYHDKPSLFYVLVGLFYRLLGVSELSARLLPATACVATLVAVYLAAATRGATTGLLASMLLASSAFFIGTGRFVNFDALLTALVTGAFLWSARRIEKPEGRLGFLPVYVFAAGGVLIKGPVVIALLAPPLALALIRGDLRRRDLELVRGTAVAAAIVCLWALPVLVFHPDYLRDFLWVHNIQRYVLALPAHHPEPFWYFLPVLLAGLLPWSPLALPALWWGLARRGVERFLADAALWIVVFFSLSAGKLATYVLPAFPLLAILVAMWLGTLTARDRALNSRRLGAAAVLAAALAPVAYVLVRLEEPAAAAVAAMVFGPASLAAAVVLVSLRRGGGSLTVSVKRLCTGMIATLLTLHAWGAGELSEYLGDRDLAAHAVATGRPDRVLAYGVLPFSFLFYTHWPLVYRVSNEDYRAAVDEPGTVWLLAKPKVLPSFYIIAPHVELVEIGSNSRHVLYEVRKPEAPSRP